MSTHLQFSTDGAGLFQHGNAFGSNGRPSVELPARESGAAFDIDIAPGEVAEPNGDYAMAALHLEQNGAYAMGVRPRCDSKENTFEERTAITPSF